MVRHTARPSDDRRPDDSGIASGDATEAEGAEGAADGVASPASTPAPSARDADDVAGDDETDRSVDVVTEPTEPTAAEDTALLGAYALGALAPGERAAVEERLAASPALREELRRLIPVAALLREATDSPPSPTERAATPATGRAPCPAGDPGSAPPPPPRRTLSVEPPDGGRADPPLPDGNRDALDDMGDRVDEPEIPRQGLYVADPSPPVPATSVDDDRPPAVRVEAAPGSLSSRAGRRPARDSKPAIETAAKPSPARSAVRLGGFPPSWVAAGLATLVAVAAILWALALVDRLDTRRAEIDALETDLAELRARGGAAVVTLVPSATGPTGADGVVVVASSEGTLIVRVSGMPVSVDGRVYQVWFQDAAGGADAPWVVGPVFRVAEGGTSLVELPAAVPPFTRLAVSDEPSPGSGAPTTPFLLEGTTTPAT